MEGCPGCSVGRAGAPFTEAVSLLHRPPVRFHSVTLCCDSFPLSPLFPVHSSAVLTENKGTKAPKNIYLKKISENNLTLEENSENETLKLVIFHHIESKVLWPRCLVLFVGWNPEGDDLVQTSVAFPETNDNDKHPSEIPSREKNKEKINASAKNPGKSFLPKIPNKQARWVNFNRYLHTGTQLKGDNKEIFLSLIMHPFVEKSGSL